MREAVVTMLAMRYEMWFNHPSCMCYDSVDVHLDAKVGGAD